jgi:hypothetical protein
MKVYIEIQNEFGIFKFQDIEVNDSQLDGLRQMCAGLNSSGSGYEDYLEDGSFIVIGPDVIKKSILSIKKK